MLMRDDLDRELMACDYGFEADSEFLVLFRLLPMLEVRL